jgi:hypothetical protein
MRVIKVTLKLDALGVLYGLHSNGYSYDIR